MPEQVNFDPVSWASLLRRSHGDRAEEVIGHYCDLCSGDASAQANWKAIRRAYLELAGREPTFMRTR